LKKNSNTVKKITVKVENLWQWDAGGKIKGDPRQCARGGKADTVNERCGGFLDFSAVSEGPAVRDF